MKKNIEKYPFAAWKSKRRGRFTPDGERGAARVIQGESGKNLGPAPELYAGNERAGTSVPYGGGSSDKRR